ncbi:MAG: twin-arginine translocation signal domain-containing protein, partial [Rhodocyclaceae bacterium]|nr:twin-arginine translocation signal domain-containing protein [Rhodocyclaceae bacterium]
MNEPQDKSRRQFVAGAAVAGAGLGVAALAPGLKLIEVAGAATPGPRPAGEPASPIVRWGMLIDTTKCKSGCDACVTACASENGINETVKDARQGSQWIRKIDLKDPKNGR